MDHGPLEQSPLGPFPFFFVRLCPMEYVSIIVTMLSLYDVIVLKKGPLKIECSYSVGGDFSFIALFQQISFFQTRNVNILSPLLWTFFENDDVTKRQLSQLGTYSIGHKRAKKKGKGPNEDYYLRREQNSFVNLKSN